MNHRPNYQHCLSTNNLAKEEIIYLIKRANYFLKEVVNAKQQLALHSGKTITPLFFEPSTRTLNSFLLAAKRLGCITLNPTLYNSATKKGESIEDTIFTFEAMGTDVFILRHSQNNFAENISRIVQPTTHVINAGDGTNQHPSQTILDLMTIQQEFNDWTQLKIAIVGDSKHSRVIGSLIPALISLGVKDIRLIGPENLLADHFKYSEITTTDKLQQGIEDANIIISLRIQKERLQYNEIGDIKNYIQKFCIKSELLDHAHPDVIVMHPGPVNRNIEITNEVINSSKSRILNQVCNGVAARMAILDRLLSN